MSPRPIVVGADGSEDSLRAVEWAAREAWRRGSPLRIVSVPEIPLCTRAHESAVTAANVLRGFAGRALGEAVIRAGEIAPGLVIDANLLSGPPALAVPEAGCGASMLVLGARGKGGFAAMVLGSVSRHTAIAAPCPVVVVREETMVIHREVVVGIRDPENPGQALAFALEEAALRDTDLVAVHACGTADPEELAAEAARQLAAALDGWRDKYPDVPVRQDVVHGHPAWVLSSYSTRADLVVLGRHDSPGTTAHAIGSVQHTVLHHARGPIAVVPSNS
jgi:nucleotide-binding universal stress UspA family protein